MYTIRKGKLVRKTFALKVMRLHMAFFHASKAINESKYIDSLDPGQGLVTVKLAGLLFWIYNHTDWLFNMANKLSKLGD